MADLVEIPEGIDDPPQFLLWSVDELIPVVLGLTIGFAINQVGICLVASLFSVKYYRRFRDSRPDGFMLHALYWTGVYPTNAKSMPNPYVRRFLP